MQRVPAIILRIRAMRSAHLQQKARLERLRNARSRRLSHVEGVLKDLDIIEAYIYERLTPEEREGLVQ